jgi:hypothetical protein
MLKWTEFLTKFFEERKKKDESYSFKQAMTDAGPEYTKYKKSNGVVSEPEKKTEEKSEKKEPKKEKSSKKNTKSKKSKKSKKSRKSRKNKSKKNRK